MATFAQGLNTVFRTSEGNNSTNRNLLILSLLLAGMLSAIFVIKSLDRQATSSAQLMSPADATRIEINSAYGKVVLALDETVGNEWHMTEPQQGAANADRVAPLLSLLRVPDRTSYTSTDLDLDELGLSNPVASVTINTLHFEFGHLTVTSDARYVRNGDRVYLYNEMVYPLISAGANALLSTQTSDASATNTSRSASQ